MPGILPMKIIKTGASGGSAAAAASRIAQACDRCRSKKIRCDGVTPCCSPCRAVGFECRTSDRLKRRAFPRGYTESLEERVRALETELRALKTVLDEREEKVDLLSKIRPYSTHRAASSPQSPDGAPDEATGMAVELQEDTFTVQRLPSPASRPDETPSVSLATTEGFISETPRPSVHDYS